MLKFKTSRRAVAILAVAALILVAGGTAIASNMAFKLNKTIVLFNQGDTGQKGNNWVALPFNNPYSNGQELCDQLGLISLPATNFATLAVLNGVNGSFSTGTCGSDASGLIIPAGIGIQIKQQAGIAGDPTPPTSFIVVGSHNPTLQLSIPPVAGASPNAGNLWFAVPYHTTAVTGDDLCASTGMNDPVARITTLNASTGQFVDCVCGGCTADLELGSFVQLRNGLGGLANVGIAHF